MPVSGLSLDALQPNSVVVVLPTIAAPCAFTRSAASASIGAMKSASVREPVSVWVSGAYMPFFGNKTLFNHMNVLAVDPWLPPGLLPAATYLVALLLLGLWLRRLVRGLLAGAKRLTHRESGEQGGAA
jgi:hypothetical protein